MTSTKPNQPPLKFRMDADGRFQPRSVTMLGWKGKPGVKDTPVRLVRAEAESDMPDAFRAIDFHLNEDGSIEGVLTLEPNFVVSPKFFEPDQPPLEVRLRLWLEPPPEAQDQSEREVKTKLYVEIESGYTVKILSPEDGLIDARAGVTEQPFVVEIIAAGGKPAAGLPIRCRIPKDERPTLRGGLVAETAKTDDNGQAEFRYVIDNADIAEGEAPGVAFEITTAAQSPNESEVEIGHVTLVAAPKIELRIDKPGLQGEPVTSAELNYDPALALGGTALIEPRALIEVEGERFESKQVIRDADLFADRSDSAPVLTWSEQHQAYQLVLVDPLGPRRFTRSKPPREGLVGSPIPVHVPIGPGKDGETTDTLVESLGDVLRASNALGQRFDARSGPEAARAFIQGLVDRVALGTADEIGNEAPHWGECAGRAAASHEETIDTALVFDRSIVLHKYSYEMFLTNWIGFCVELFFGWFLDAAVYMARTGVSTGAILRPLDELDSAGSHGSLSGLGHQIRRKLGSVKDYFKLEIDLAAEAVDRAARRLDELNRDPLPDSSAARAAGRELSDDLAAKKQHLRELERSQPLGDRLRSQLDDLHGDIRRYKDLAARARAELPSLQEAIDASKTKLDELNAQAESLRQQQAAAGPDAPPVSRLTDLEESIAAIRTSLSINQPKLDAALSSIDTYSQRIDGLQNRIGEINARLADGSIASAEDVSTAKSQVREVENQFESKIREVTRIDIEVGRRKLEIQKAETARDILELRFRALEQLRAKAEAPDLTTTQAKELIENMRTRQTQSIRARLIQLRDHVQTHLEKEFLQNGPKLRELYHPNHNVMKDFSATADEILALKNADPNNIEGLLGKLNLPLVSGLHGEAGEDAAKGEFAGEPTEKLQEKLEELDQVLREAKEESNRFAGSKMVPEQVGWFRWVLDMGAEAVSTLLGLAVSGVYWVLVIASFGGVYFLLEAAKAVLSRMMAGLFYGIYSGVRMFGDVVGHQASKGPEHKHSPEHIAKVKATYSAVPSLAGFFMDPRSNRGARGDITHVLGIIASPADFFQGSKERDRTNIHRRFANEYDGYYRAQQQTFKELVAHFSSMSLNPKNWTRATWPTALAPGPTLDELLAEAKDYEGDFLAARDGKFTSSAARLLEDGEYTWQDYDQLIDWFVWAFGTCFRLLALIGAIAVLFGTAGGGVLIIPGALVAADVAEVLSMAIRSVIVSLLTHNRVVGIQEDIVVTAALRHDARFGKGGNSDG